MPKACSDFILCVNVVKARRIGRDLQRMRALTWKAYDPVAIYGSRCLRDHVLSTTRLPGCPAEMNSPVFDTVAEDVLRELLTAPSQEDAQSDWEAAAAEAMEMVAPLPAAAGPEPAQNNASVELPGPTQTPRKRGRSPSRRTGSVRRRI